MDKYRRCDGYTYEKQPYNLYEDVNNNDFTPLVNTILQKEQSFNIYIRPQLEVEKAF